MTVPWMHSGSCRTRSALVSAKLFLQLSISSPISQERIKSLLIYPPIPFSQPLPSTCLFLPFRSARRTFTRPTHSPSIASMYGIAKLRFHVHKRLACLPPLYCVASAHPLPLLSVYSTPARHHRRRRHQPRPFLCTTPCRTSHMAKFAESQSITSQPVRRKANTRTTVLPCMHTLHAMPYSAPLRRTPCNALPPSVRCRYSYPHPCSCLHLSGQARCQLKKARGQTGMLTCMSYHIASSRLALSVRLCDRSARRGLAMQRMFVDRGGMLSYMMVL
ncbi:hypothetical protein IWX48DRAFT_264062 [Phyllosticta citricarpa]